MDIFEAARTGNIEEIKSLIDEDADLEAQDDQGKTPLHYAAEKGHKEVVQVLIDADAYLDAQDDQGKRPLHYAVRHQETLEVLIKNDSPLNNRTELHYAVLGRDIDKVRALIGTGINLDAQDIDGNTPLIFAAIHGHISEAQALIDAGASLKVEDKLFYSTPLIWAVNGGHVEVVQVIIRKSPFVSKEELEYTNALVRKANEDQVEIDKTNQIRLLMLASLPNLDFNFTDLPTFRKEYKEQYQAIQIDNAKKFLGLDSNPDSAKYKNSLATAVLCARIRDMPYLPPEMWLEIFEFVGIKAIGNSSNLTLVDRLPCFEMLDPKATRQQPELGADIGDA